MMTEHAITIDSEVFEALKGLARPFEDHVPNDVLRRLLEIDGDGAAYEAPAVGRSQEKLLPAEEYELPLLRYLVEHDGRAPAQEVIEAVGKAVDDRLTERDRQRIKSGRIRWKNRIQFVRLRLTERGELKKDSPRGTWEITEKGCTRVRKVVIL